ncbi:hypothetical protein K470DRAFT_278295 [Piedraia hortae CBS 480.64]|uniref:Restriction of telomere capping protein 4 n=1 Tax=Piedraia hortae CBS 480.64 TaxID=1314780 RepID=A0A6A7BUH1_9PEZI|nr:hypothetical protein K470DRAFT_278295 [Piedraia hortae CBS 480.64]
MPQLNRSTRPLLSTVQGRPHASSADHEPTASGWRWAKGSRLADVDVLAEPFSSDDEKESKRLCVKSSATTSVPSTAASTATPASSDDTVLSSQSSSSLPFENFHAPRKPKIGYGIKQRQKQAAAAKKAERKQKKAAQEAQDSPVFARPKALVGLNEFLEPRGQETSKPSFQLPKHDTPDLQQPSFQLPKHAPDPESPRPTFQLPSLPSDLITPPNPNDEITSSNIIPLDSPPKKQPNAEPCPICGVVVPSSIREQFNLQTSLPLAQNTHTYRRQQRFCRFHKQHTARELWAERSYPTIDFTGLSTRLAKQRHNIHLRRVLSATKQSVFREMLEEVSGGSNRSLVHAMKDGGHGRGVISPGAGYYGPKGQRIMAEYVLNAYSVQVRNLVSKDALFAASGVAGGTTGLLNSILVPELACSLIGEDLGVTADRAVRVLEESRELGELIHPEVGDDIAV